MNFYQVLVALFLVTFSLGTAQEVKVEPTHARVSYGPLEDQWLNFWQVPTKEPVGLLVHIHGGGWIGGNATETVNPAQLKKGYSFASVEYPLAGNGHVQPIMVHSAARAIQFLRTKADEWGFDPKRIVVTGSSAGAASSFWLAFHDDLADPDNEDPVLRQSTRISGAVCAGGQSTLDPFLIKERIGEECNKHGMLFKPMGASSFDELIENWDTKYRKLSTACTGLAHITKDDPPVYMTYKEDMSVPAKNPGHGIHHGVFGVLVQEKAKKVGVTTYLKIGKSDNEPELSSNQFIDQLLLSPASE
ncbi:MAG: alpha/beta hydrolase [Verrucomicrobiota bacterium]